MIKADGGSAFPYSHEYGDDIGMTLRDWFATHCPMTMADYVRAYGFETLKQLLSDENPEQWPMFLKLFCDFRYEYADAMLKAGGLP